MTAKLKVLVVEDSLTIRKRLVEVLNQSSEFEVVAEAEDGRQAIDRCLELRPNAVTMDIVLPTMSGLAATEYIMAHAPTPILVVSSSTNRGELFKTYDALAAGAVDVISKPSGAEPPGAWEQAFLRTLRIVSRVPVITHPRARLNGLSRPRADPSEAVPRTDRAAIVALGASTGGPSALVRVLSRLPRDFVLPVLVVIHLAPPFATAFADWLEAQVGRRVSYARSGQRVRDLSGRVVLAPPEEHLVVRDGQLVLTRDPERHACRPSVDVLFESLASEYGAVAVAALLTGMGRDGASGLLSMRRAGARTIAQDESSSVVYGMPREAAEIGGAERVLSLEEIAPALVELAGGRA